MIQKEMELSEKCIKFIINDNIMKLIMKIYIKIININDNNKEILNMNMKLRYFELRLYDQMKIPEINKLLKIIDQIKE